METTPTPENESCQYVVVTLDAQPYALSLGETEQVLLAAALTPIPEAGPLLMGLLNLRGRIIPVLDIRRRLQLPGRALSAADRIVVTRTRRYRVAIVVDEILGVRTIAPSGAVEGGAIFPHLQRFVQAVGRLADRGPQPRSVLIYDIERLFPEDLLADVAAHAGWTSEIDLSPGP